VAAASKSTAIPPKLRLLQLADQRLGPALTGAFRPRATGPRDLPVPAEAVRRLLVLRPGGLGDAVLLRPMLDALRAAYPGALIDVLAERRNAGALALGNPPFDVILYDERPLTAIRRLRAARYDLVVDTEQCHHFSVLAANALAPRWLCGFATLGRERFHTHPVPYSDERYEVESFLDLARAVTGRHFAFDPERAWLAADAASLAFADAALAAAAGRPVVVVLPAAGGSYRLWPPERYGEVARALVAGGAFVAVLGGADAVAAAAAVCAALPADAALDLSGRTTLAQAAGVLARARLALGADSGVLHLAGALGTPTLTLFGPALFRKWGPPGRRHGLVRLGLPCSPCVRLGRLPVCPIDVACMRDLGVERVLEALATLGVPAGTAGPFRDLGPASR
jgi:ADP-heptose:LPS heptosyltransferase